MTPLMKGVWSEGSYRERTRATRESTHPIFFHPIMRKSKKMNQVYPAATRSNNNEAGKNQTWEFAALTHTADAYESFPPLLATVSVTT
ncbi:MAG: hypothetical protein A4E42_01250 [Methanoregulaceae archaeon PtaU1.Bin222]|nr:MAG: hypothetical protein A4E42_01250 [Methanoregulaceae archaeon PtaU1.Bin222]